MTSWKTLICGSLLASIATAGAKETTTPTAAVASSPAASSTAAPSTSAVGEPAEHSLTKADADSWLDGYMPYALNASDIAGAVVAIVKDGKILTARGFGYADVDQRTPVDPERTLFRPGSVSKLVTWTAVMQMVEQKKLDLDADINTYLDFRIPPYNGQPVTVRQLMTHTAGFEEATKNIIFYDRKNLKPLGDYLKASIPRRIFAPGTTSAYSNWGTALAAYLVQRVSGEDFDDYLDRHIFGPLGMRNATFRQPLPANFATQMATGYPKPGQPSPGFELIGPAPAGSLSASGTDMARLMLAHLQNGELDGQRILSIETAQLMHNSPLDKINPKSLIPPLNRMELGFFETNINGREVIGHLGDTSAFHTSLHLFMQDGVGFYVSFSSPGKAGAVGALRTAMFTDFADRYFPNHRPVDGTVDATTSAQHARLMSGRWIVSRRSDSSFMSMLTFIGQAKITVGPKGELLIPSLTRANGRPRAWQEIAPFIWRDRDGHDRLAAQVVDGKVVRWSMDFMSPFMVFDRPAAGLSAAWILPALYLSLAVLAMTCLLWPIGWWARRHYHVALSLTGTALSGYRRTRLFATLSVAVLVGWVVALTTMLSNLENLSGAFDPVLWLLQIVGAVTFVGAVLVNLWNLRVVWREGGRWTRKLWSLLLLLASIVVLYVALRFGLLAFSVNY